jgi:hypothetical protein
MIPYQPNHVAEVLALMIYVSAYQVLSWEFGSEILRLLTGKNHGIW